MKHAVKNTFLFNKAKEYEKPSNLDKESGIRFLMKVFKAQAKIIILKSDRMRAAFK